MKNNCLPGKLLVSIVRPKGFTLIELVSVVFIIGLLIVISLPAIQMVREAARRNGCLNNVRQTSLALLNYASARTKLPSGITSASERPFGSQSFLQVILPFLDQGGLYNDALKDYERFPSPFHGHLGMQTVVVVFQCPSDPSSGQSQFTYGGRIVATTNYLGVNGTDWDQEDGVFYRDSQVRLADIADGLSNTLLLGERPPSPDFAYGWWYTGLGQNGTGSGDMLLGVRERRAPGAPYLGSCPDGPYQFVPGRYGRQCDTLHYWSHHPGGAVFAMCDGSTRLISYDANEIMPQLATRDGGETATVPE